MKKTEIKRELSRIGFALLIIFINITFAKSQSLWDTAKENKDVLTVTTLFTAQNVRDYLSTTENLNTAIDWCKETGITKVYIETFRGGYYVDREILINAKNRFLNEGFEVSGCVTTTRLGKDPAGRGWGSGSCYSNEGNRENLQRIFDYTASIFDEIMIDDFLFTECECEECIAARGNQPWSDFRNDLMVKMSRERILKPAKAVNPDAKVIIKYPLWYDDFQKRGYDVIRESRDYDKIYIGTETRDYNYDIRSSGEVQYNAYFIMRWLGSIGGDKTGGGWFDALGTTPNTYLEQARQTVLGGAKEIMLFCYSNLIHNTNFYNGWFGTGVANVEALRKELPGLFELAGLLHGKEVKGIHMPKLPDSKPYEEPYVFSLLGMLGLPLVPDYEINKEAGSSIFTVHILEKPGFSNTLQEILDKGTPVVITDGLAKRMTNQALLDRDNLTVLKVDGEPNNLLKLTQEELKPIRDQLLAPMGMHFDAPNKVGLYLFGDNCFVIENFNDRSVDVTLDLASVSDVSKVLMLPEEGNTALSRNQNGVRIQNLSPRSLILVEYH